jgi:excisionase family DNA binding protein
MNNTMLEELLTVEEAAVRLKLNPQTIRRWIRAGLLPAQKLGRKVYRIAASDLAERTPLAAPYRQTKRTEAVQRLLLLREKLRDRGISAAELVAESRAELEGRGDTSSR